jgi:hypothetical protein
VEVFAKVASLVEQDEASGRPGQDLQPVATPCRAALQDRRPSRKALEKSEGHAGPAPVAKQPVRYTARTGESAFAETVKKEIGGSSMGRAWLLNLATDFSDEWQTFMSKPSNGLAFAVERRLLPSADQGGKVTAIYLHYEPVKDPVDDLSRQAIELQVGTDQYKLKPAPSRRDCAATSGTGPDPDDGRQLLLGSSRFRVTRSRTAA